MTYTTSFSIEFTKNLPGFPKLDQLKIAYFQTTFENVGLGNFSQYRGKIGPSWKGLFHTDPKYTFAHGNDLWHYHVGIPVYTPSPFGPYSTSDWQLHFIWPDWKNNGPHIHVVDLLQHNHYSGPFNLPLPTALP